MSLIRVRRERREVGHGTRRGVPPGRMIVLLALVLTLMWFLGRL